MELTRQRAVALSIELWEWLAESGGEKEDWPGWKWNGGQHSDVVGNCFLCERSWGRDGNHTCKSCPYYTAYGECDADDYTPYGRWRSAVTAPIRKQYARECLQQLKRL